MPVDDELPFGLALLPAAESRPRRSAPLDAALAARLGGLLADAPATGKHRTEEGETYTALGTDLVVEVLAGTSRHATLNVARARGAASPRPAGPPGSGRAG
ncbi:hypothetical protein ACWGQ9_28570 [Streptomyces parvus]